MTSNGMMRRGGGAGSGGGSGMVPEEQFLLTERNKANIININGEKQAFLTPEPVRLTPAWEETNLPNDELNFKGVTMEQAHLETNPPDDRWNIVYIIFILHGIGTLLPWNMFINAKAYFVEYKFSSNYTGVETDYGKDFLAYVGIAAQGPNLIFNWLNIFVRIGGKLTTRIVWSIVVEMVCFVVTVILAMTDSAAWPGLFFWSTMFVVVILNMAGGIYQNTVYGMAAKLPTKYTGAIILGSNVSGTFASLISIGSLLVAPSLRTAAIYYFITALFVLSLCFDTYFALPLNRFYKYNELMSQKAAQKRLKENPDDENKKAPFFKIFKECFPQCFNIFCIFFVTLTLFPSVHSDVKKTDPNFFIGDDLYVQIVCFLTFNVAAMIGSSLPALGSWPSPKYLWIPVLARFAFIPLFVLCNYQPQKTDRILPVLIHSDYAFWAIGAAMGVTSGYFSSVAMMYCPRSVKSPEHAPIAGMMGGACIITGICAGLGASMFFPWLVENVTLPI